MKRTACDDCGFADVHHPNCPSRPVPGELARRVGLALYALCAVPIIVAVLFDSPLNDAWIVGAVLLFWATLYIGARFW
jgi:hypothetical protein